MFIRPYGQQINTELCRVHPHDCFAVIGSKTMYGVLYIACLLRLPRPDQLSVHDAQLCQPIVKLRGYWDSCGTSYTFKCSGAPLLSREENIALQYPDYINYNSTVLNL